MILPLGLPKQRKDPSPPHEIQAGLQKEGRVQEETLAFAHLFDHCLLTF